MRAVLDENSPLHRDSGVSVGNIANNRDFPNDPEVPHYQEIIERIDAIDAMIKEAHKKRINVA